MRPIMGIAKVYVVSLTMGTRKFVTMFTFECRHLTRIVADRHRFKYTISISQCDVLV